MTPMRANIAGPSRSATRSSALEPLTAESTKPVAEVRTHAGLVKVKRYSLDMA